MKEEELSAYGKKIRTDNRKTFRRKMILSLMGLLFIVFMVKCSKGDYKFYFKTTAETKGAIVDTKIYNQGWFYTQDVLYEYTVDDSTYQNITTRFRIVSPNLSIRVIYAEENPAVHEVVW